MSRFFFGDSDSEDSNDENALPYPKPLARSAFLTPDFSPTEFLSSLHNRHQTLEDLRVELRTRSQELNKELLDLVNDNYQDFLGLGSSLKGGEEKIEEIKLGLLRFQREVDGLKGSITKRRVEVEELYEQRKLVSREVRKGKALLQVSTRLEELEDALKVNAGMNGIANGHTSDSEFTESDDSEDDDDEDVVTSISTTRLRRRVQQFVYLRRLMEKIGPAHPFIAKANDRVSKVRQTLLLDLNNALAESRKSDSANERRLLKVLSLYRDIDDSQEALSAIKELRR